MKTAELHPPFEPETSHVPREKRAGSERLEWNALAVRSRNGRGGAQGLVLGGLVLLATFIWSYWTTLLELVETWNREPDYSHGFLVLPVALYCLWLRRDSAPRGPVQPSLTGLALIALSMVMRIVGSLFYVDALEGWSILVWVAGSAMLLGGRHWLRWSLPAIAFLIFMVPLPYRVEQFVRWPLQRMATSASTVVLQSLGQPAFAEGNTILLGMHRLEIEEACSGLRILMGIIALSCAYVITARRGTATKILVVASAVPVALTANAARIVVTGLLYENVSSRAAATFSHDVAGWVMIPLAAMLFALMLWFLNRLVQEVQPLDVGDQVRRKRLGTSSPRHHFS